MVNEHRIEFDNSRVVDLEANDYKRLFVESWHFQETAGNVNRSTGALPIESLPQRNSAHHGE